MRQHSLCILAFLPVLAFGAGCVEKQSVAGEEKPATDDRSEVRMQPPRIADIPELVRFSATVTNPEVIGVSSQLPGTIAQVLVDEGQVVEKDQELLRLDEQELKLHVEQATKALSGAEVRLEQLRLAAVIEQESLELGVKQAESALAQIQAKAKMVEEGARPEEKRQVAAVVEMARTQMEAMGRETERMKGLYADEVIPKQRLEQLEDGYKVAQAQFQQASEQLKLVQLGAREEDREAMAAAVDQMRHAVAMAQVGLKQIEARKLDIKATELAVDQARTALELAKLAAGKAVVKAPCRGFVDAVSAKGGMLVAPGTPLITLAVLDKLEARALLQQAEVMKVRSGMEVTYTVDGAEQAGPFRGKVVHVGAMADLMTRGFPVDFAVAEKDMGLLKGGMHVKGEITVGTHARAMLLPASAVLRREGAKVVFVVEDGLARQRKVETGMNVGKELEVVSGLSADSQVVHEGHLGLVDGVAVKPAASDATAAEPTEVGGGPGAPTEATPAQ